jgi:murein DD-endopeptidase MepM/ murein hydrolase activator NlpD
MKLLIFLGGTLFGALAFLVVMMVRPEPATMPLVVAPPVAAAPKAAVPRGTPSAALVAPSPAAQAPSSPAPVAAAPVAPVPGEQLRKNVLLVPVLGVKASQLSDTFHETRGGNRPHEALDILAPRGTQVIAVDDGRIVKLFKSVPGGLTIYQFDPSERFAYYYAHLDGYASDLAEGLQVKRGEVIGYVGSTGNANPATPHLHFAIFELGPEKRWWKGTAINPYPLLTGR